MTGVHAEWIVVDEHSGERNGERPEYGRSECGLEDSAPLDRHWSSLLGLAWEGSRVSWSGMRQLSKSGNFSFRHQTFGARGGRMPGSSAACSPQSDLLLDRIIQRICIGPPGHDDCNCTVQLNGWNFSPSDLALSLFSAVSIFLGFLHFLGSRPNMLPMISAAKFLFHC